MVVLKNNVPTGYILSPKEYERYSELEEDYVLLAEAEADFSDLDTSIQRQVLKGIQKVAANPLPSFQGGYRKPLGNKDRLNLTNLLKIKFRDIGIRVVYKTITENGIMKIIVISARSDEKVYKEAAKRRKKHDL